MDKYPYTGHDRGVVVEQPQAGQFTERPMTIGELAARDVALKFAKDIHRLACYPASAYFEMWRAIADAIDAPRPEEQFAISDERVTELAVKAVNDGWGASEPAMFVIDAIRQALHESARPEATERDAIIEECAAVLDRIIAAMASHTDAAGNVTGEDFHEPEITYLRDAAKDIRALMRREPQSRKP